MHQVYPLSTVVRRESGEIRRRRYGQGGSGTTLEVWNRTAPQRAFLSARSGRRLTRLEHQGKGKPVSIEGRSSALTKQEVAELKARHLACSHLVKGCQDAIISFRAKTASPSAGQEASAGYRAIEILEEVLGSWCDTLSILRSALNQTSSRKAASDRRFELIPGVLKNESSRQGADTANARRS